MTDEQPKLWGGRFTKTTDSAVEQFSSSVGYDQRLYRQDIAGSAAHARMLASVGILTRDELSAIINGLQKIQLQIESNLFPWSVELEDVHMNIEQQLD